jgi:hypothetical protein
MWKLEISDCRNFDIIGMEKLESRCGITKKKKKKTSMLCLVNL